MDDEWNLLIWVILIRVSHPNKWYVIFAMITIKCLSNEFMLTVFE